MACWGAAEVDELEKVERRFSSAEEGEAERGVEGGCGSSCEELVLSLIHISEPTRPY